MRNKKRGGLIALVCALILIAAMLASCSETGAGGDVAEDEGEDSLLSFTLLSDGSGYAVSGLGEYAESELVIPARYKGKDVVAIEDKAFKKCTSITSLEIKGALSIGEEAFSGCSSLVSADIPLVTAIGEEAFASCKAFEFIIIPDSVERIGKKAFNGSPALQKVDGIFYVDGWIVGSDKSAKVEIKAGVRGLADYAFAYSEKAKDVVIPDGVKALGEYAFGNCGRLTSVVIPEGIKTIGYGTFSGCPRLKSVNIPSTVTEIGGYAFNNCPKIKSLTIPAGVKSIGRSAFFYCTELVNVKFLGTVEEWQAISKGADWKYYTGAFTVDCTDGVVSKLEA